MVLNVPNTNIDLHPGDIIRIGRFSEIDYEVQYGWYTWGGNRPVCGWSLRNLATGDVKPLQSIDLVDMYMISHAPASDAETVTLSKYASYTTYTVGQLLYFTFGEVYQATKDFTSSGSESTDAENLDVDISLGNITKIV